MKKIKSFEINHDVLEKGLYVSRIDGDVVTYDVRMKKPNGGDYLGNAELHTLEHLLATFARNSPLSDSVVYVGPMGCRTGFYVLLRNTVGPNEAISLLRRGFEFVRSFTGEIPGAQKRECGNYLEHDLDGAKKIAADMIDVLTDWNETKLTYKE
ncbi:MAG: S-ribosylhomocysteine lyase [Alphaproteobacteria bacterium]|nr:S-ribosylhomocysteine lyase [Alphaproteobacteria bacterium]